MQSIQIPVTQVGLEQSIQAAMKKASGSAQINLGSNARQINSLSQPLGRITGQADEFTKSMAAANARVLAFGASAGIMAGVAKALTGIVTTTIKVEKSLANINSVLNISSSELQKFGGKLFDVAKNTGQTFDQVAEAATELARQGLGATETIKRLNDALILSRLSGLDAAKSVEGLTAAYNSFSSAGVTTSEILNKLVVVSQKFAVSEKDLIEGLKRSASVANQAGVSLDELIAIITAVQEKTARGGAVIGNSFKTIFARLQDRAVLKDLDALGVVIEDTATQKALPATAILQNLATSFGSLSQLRQADIAKKLGGVYQLSNLLAAIQDMSSETSKYQDTLKKLEKVGEQAYEKNAVLNMTLESLINKVTISAQELGNTLGEIGVTDNLKNILSFFNGLLEGVQNILGEESALGSLFRGLAKGVSAIISGPGLALFGAVILKLSKDLVQFGFASLKSFFGIGKAAKEIQNVEMSIQQILSRNVDMQQKLFALEGNRAAQLQVITSALIQQEAIIRKTAATASSLAPAVYNVGGRASSSGLRVGNSAGGYVPAVAKESQAIKSGVGGARSGDKPVVIPNFNFGGGRRGTMVAHTGEYIVPNFAGKGSAIFNRNMVKSMGLPSGAQKINAAGGFIPNFAKASLLPKEVVDSFNPEDLKYYNSVKSKKAVDIENILQSEGKVRGSGKLAYTTRQIEIVKMVQKARAKAAEDVPKMSFDTSQFNLPGGKGLGLIGISGKESTSRVAEKKLKDTQIQILKNAGVTERDKNLAIEFTNIKTNSLGNIKNLNAEQVQKDFQQRVNSLFAEPLRVLANDIFGSLGGISSSGDLKDKYLFGSDALGNIFESSINLYTKKAEDLESFDEGEAMRNKAFDFNMTNKYQADKINSLFFSQIGGVGKADAKRRITTAELRSVIDKSINDPDVRLEMRRNAMMRSAASGYIPNFANPLQDAISREIAAGVPASQIYIDKNPRLKSSSNPMGLMVANRRDEPSGGFQGVNRAVREGKDPKTYGAAGGFIPNFAPFDITGTALSGPKGQAVSFTRLNKAINDFVATLDLAKIDLTIASEAKALKDQIRKLTEVSKLEKNSKEAVAKAGLDYVKSEKAATTANTSLTEVTKNKEKTTSDYVGKLFLLQSVTSGLMAAFGDLDNGLEKAAYAASQIAGSVLSWREITDFKQKQKSEPLSESQILLNDFSSARGSRNAAGARTAAQAISQRGGVVGTIAARAAGGGRLAGLAGGTLGVISKVGPLFGRFVPILGQVITAYQIVNAGLKAFGIDLTGGIAKALKWFGQSLGLVATDAEKTAESFRKSREKAGEKILAGEFNKGFEISGTLNDKLTEARKKEIEKRIGSDAAAGADNEELRKKEFNKLIEGASFGINQKFMAERAGLTPEELQKQYTAGKGLQKKYREEIYSTSGEEFSSTFVDKFKGLSKPQAELLGMFEADLAGSYSSEESQKAFAKAKEQNLQGDQLQPFINDLFQSAYKNLEKAGKLDQVNQFKTALANAGDYTDPKELEELVKLFNQLTANIDKSAVVSKAIEAANLNVLQKRLDASLAYQQSLFESTTSEEISLGIKRDMLGLSKLEKFEAESKLETIKLQKQATLEQAKASVDLLRNSEVLNARLDEVGLGQVSEKSFAAVAEISEEINRLILEQGGYTAEVESKAKSLLEYKLGEDKASESILAILKATNEPIQKNLKLQESNNAILNAQKASLEAIDFLEEKRRQSVSSSYEIQSRTFDLAKRSIDTELEAFKIQKEREKIGKNAAESLAIDKQIAEKETLAIKAKVEFDKQDIINNLRKQFSDAALELGLNLENEIQGANTLDQFNTIASKITEEERRMQMARLDASIAELSNSKVASDYFLQQVTSAANYLNEKIAPGKGIADYYNNFNQQFSPYQPLPSQPAAITNLREQERNLISQKNAIAGAVITSPLGAAISDAFAEIDLTAREAANQVNNLDNSLIAAGANLTTFSNLVANVFRDLADQITQNAFGLLSATDASSISTSLIESEKFANLKAGPQTADTIKNAENRKALLIQELEVKKAITAEDRVSRQFELNQLVDILALKEEALAAETSEERLKILDKIIAKERERAPLVERLSAIISPTQEEKMMRLEDTLVSASKTFRDNMVDALTNAIDQGGSLADILRSAAYDYVKTINRENIGNIFDSALNVGKSGISSLFKQFASGGKVMGGSGTKDDVPAMLMGGEYVINKRAVQKYGPQFLEALNSGSLGGFAAGGPVQRGPQGNFYTPGTFGTGSIEGKRNLLDFATQSGTSGKFDRMTNIDGYQSIALEPESSRLSMMGMRSSPAFEATQAAKQQAFDLYLQQYNQEQEAKKAEKEQKKALRNQLIMMAVTAGLGAAGKSALTGGKNAVNALGKDAGFWQKIGAFGKGTISGGDIGEGIMGGGLKNLFSGNFGLAYQSKILKALPVGGGMTRAKSYPRSLTKDSINNLQNSLILPLPQGEGGINTILFPNNKATGGMIPPTSGIDTVPAMLSGGEFIMNRAAVQNIGVSKLQSMNTGASSASSDETVKDLNERLIAKLDELIQVSGSSGDININVSSSGETSQQDSGDTSDARQKLARQIRDSVMQVIQEEKRIGGSLRR
jgi:TP901 family phage tail tape measure protein